jgi:peptidoglycan hydrolase CwlO-like protein
MNDITVAAFSFLSALLSSATTYIFTRRKNRADAGNRELDNVDKAISIWRALAQDLEKKIEKLEQQMKEMEENNKKKCDSCKYRKHYLESKKGE